MTSLERYSTRLEDRARRPTLCVPTASRPPSAYWRHLPLPRANSLAARTEYTVWAHHARACTTHVLSDASSLGINHTAPLVLKLVVQHPLVAERLRLSVGRKQAEQTPETHGIIAAWHHRVRVRRVNHRRPLRRRPRCPSGVHSKLGARPVNGRGEVLERTRAQRGERGR